MQVVNEYIDAVKVFAKWFIYDLHPMAIIITFSKTLYFENGWNQQTRIC